MRAGRLRDRATFKSPPTAQDGHGALTGAHVVEFARRAEIVDLSGREYYAAAAIHAEVTTRISLRLAEAILAQWVAVDEVTGREFDILSARHDRLGRETILLAKERLS